MIGNHGYQIILGNILKNPLLKENLTEVYVAMKAEVLQCQFFALIGITTC